MAGSGAGSGSRTYPRGMNWLLGAHSLWWDSFLSFDTQGRGLVPPQLGMPDFVHSPRKEGLTPSEECMGWEGRKWRGWEKEVGTGVGM